MKDYRAMPDLGNHSKHIGAFISELIANAGDLKDLDVSCGGAEKKPIQVLATKDLQQLLINNMVAGRKNKRVQTQGWG